MNSNQLHTNTQLLKKWASELGFSHCGIAKSTYLEEEAPKLDAWLKNNYHGKMKYMENHFDMRLNPKLLVPNAKSVISLTYNYFTDKQQNPDAPKISKYAYGEDYHFVVKDKLKELLYRLEQQIGEINGRCFVDSAPILERVWAKRAGIGWLGKNSLLINKKQGSFFFLAEIIVDVDFIYDDEFITDHCGTCTACVDACPTDAILLNNTIDGSKCISYFTIELKDSLPTEYKNKFENWMFGCDVCQDVCPWNRFSIPHQEPRFTANDKILKMNRKEWKELTKDVFDELFKKSAVKRTKYEGLKRNIDFLLK